VDFIKSVRKVDEVLREAQPYIKHRARIVKVHVDEACGRVLASDIIAPIDVPPYDRAVVDGYAVRAEDTYSASPASPVILRVVKNSSRVRSGEAVPVSVGDRLPDGANAVIMREHVVERGEYIDVLRPVQEYANISRRGEDFRKGELVVPRGRVLNLLDIAAIVSCGFREVEIFDITAALICTGNEVKDINDIASLEELERGAVPNTTRYIVTWFLERLGVKVTYLGTVMDDENLIAERVQYALDRFDIVITTGGLAVSSRDVTYRAIEKLRPDYMQRGLAIRPGRPTSIAVVHGKPVIMLSGFPLAALTGLYYVAPRVISMLTNCEIRYDRFLVYARLTTRITKPPHLRALVRAKVKLSGNTLIAEPLTAVGSGLISTLVRGNALIDVPEGLEGHDEGETLVSELLRGTSLEE